MQSNAADHNVLQNIAEKSIFNELLVVFLTNF